MEFLIKSGNPEKQRTACLIVGIFEPRRLTPAAKAIDNISKKFLSNLIRRGDIEGKSGQSLLLHNVPGLLADRVLLIGCGKERDLTDSQYRTIITNSIKELKETGAMEAVSYLSELNVRNRDYYWKIRQTIEATEGTLYQFNEYKTKNKPNRRQIKKLVLTVPTRKELPDGELAAKHAMAIVKGIKLTRDLANRPANICTPVHLAEQAKNLGKLHRSIKVTVLDEDDMTKLGMNTLLSVTRGSVEPAKLITLEYKGAKKEVKPIVLVGKGVTFDTGGISIKPAAAMDEMKYDMCGAASVLGTLLAVAEIELPINVVGVIPTTENMPDGRATKPGDIIKSMSGQTVEILNTDAEGRLILCDALTYSERFHPQVVIDIATLTGACVIALGNHASGLLSNHNPLARDLLNAGESSGDRAWQLPLWEEYNKQLDSPFADMANIGGREAGTITAACFLSRFAEKYHWAHLDIAGTAWTSGKNKGATGRPVPLLTQYLLDKSK
ncbi:MAG: leucyl aminopeptidase [Gammaproteobacteria bacterium RIFCSPLOWO2_02_FULL_47_50]|nr:MAG: leucyl aminopeptidase [Gammaproteobacteria bacterium RIFCSPLOWO2_02_47_7]OGT67216.1 MAG: leucyl aminopeptidase [Gammaproteobacteria bacterium RIFCSPLOWO2_01_FULL_47_190]OGT81722.1 MAG: leucyl aminopeptidase [Gammaproteobacteria bacterium RIFCSPLOWO2_02_FULL_47_50]OGT83654.1 MAG: leucyl aminopeptidase [Gammaproteobacteria bacterium RIFCSPLOWO2_12_FULL_47_76]